MYTTHNVTFVILDLLLTLLSSICLYSPLFCSSINIIISFSFSTMKKHDYKVSLKDFLKLFKCLASSNIHLISRRLDLLFIALHQERKRKK